jgi:hypothetical protein
MGDAQKLKKARNDVNEQLTLFKYSGFKDSGLQEQIL